MPSVSELTFSLAHKSYVEPYGALGTRRPSPEQDMVPEPTVSQLWGIFINKTHSDSQTSESKKTDPMSLHVLHLLSRI